MALPRVITVDPTWTIPRILRSALDLTDRMIIQVDVPSAELALEEVKAGCDLVLMAFNIDEHTKGFELAIRIHHQNPDVALIILGDVNDPAEFEDEGEDESPFLYMSKPLDPYRFLRVLEAGLTGEDIKAAQSVPASTGTSSGDDWGPVPPIDTNAARSVIDTLLIDIGAMALLMADRQGQVLVESGAVGYLNREELAGALSSSLITGFDLKDMVGGQLSTVQFFDGDDYDLFVLSVGLHHFLCIVFDGQSGSRQFGVVNRYGRNAVEDLIALIGASAFLVQRTVKPVEDDTRRKKVVKKVEGEDFQPLERAVLEEQAPAQPAEPDFQLDPIEASADELADLFGDGDFDVDDDFFDLDDLEELAKENQSKKGLDWDEAKRLGAIK